MDMNASFKAAVGQALGRPVIVADRFHFSRYIYWAMDEVRRKVQKEWDKYNRTQCKRMRHVFYKRAYIVADAGYGSEQNYDDILSNRKREALITYTMYVKEQKKMYKQNEFNTANWDYDKEND